MNTDKNNTTNAHGLAARATAIPEELERLIARVERHQAHLGLNDARFVTRYGAHLKTVDSWVRTLKRRDTDRLTRNNVGKWTQALRKLVAEIDGVAADEAIIETMPMLQCAVSLYDRLQAATTDRRVAWLIGPTGTGKSVAMRHLRRANPRDTAYAIVTPLWKDNKRTITVGLAAALGVTVKTSAAETWDALVEQLKGAPVTLLLDEVHEGGVLLLKLIKTLVNQVPTVRVLLSTWPTGYKRVAGGGTEAYDEARQLLGRSLRPIYQQWSAGVREADITAYLDSAAPEIDAEARPVLVSRIAAPVKEYGLRLLADAVDAARRLADSRDADLTADAVHAAIEQMAASI